MSGQQESNTTNNNGITKQLLKHSVLVIVLLLVFGGAGILYYFNQQQQQLVQALVLQNARLHIDALTEFRTLYSEKVVSVVRKQGVEISHDIHANPHAIPLPATLSMMLGNRISFTNGTGHSRLYSPWPFPWRKEQSGLIDEFDKTAWAFFQQNPDQAYFRFEQEADNGYLHYATADVMRESCLDCHNTHPDTPKNDWKLGDVRGILTVKMPLSNAAAQARDSLKGSFSLVVGLSLLVIISLGLMIRGLRKAIDKTRDANIQLAKEVDVRIHAEETLQQFNQVLEQQVEQRTNKLQKTNTHLQNSLQQLHDAQNQLIEAEKMASLGGLVTGIAHEINTPLGIGITGITHVEDLLQVMEKQKLEGSLTSCHFDDFFQQAKESINIILSNLQRGAELIQNFKQVAVDHSSDDQREFNVKQYLEELVVVFKSKLNQGGHQVRIICDDQLNVISFPGTLYQILSNLLLNAIIHGFEEKESGTITIEIKLKERQLEILFKDNGRGMNAHAVEHIFEPFFTTKRSLGYIGLGTHIIYNLVVQKLGGTIHCKSQPDQGCSYTIIIPVRIALE